MHETTRVTKRLVGQLPFARGRQRVGEDGFDHAARRPRGEAELETAAEGMADQADLVESQVVERRGKGVEHLFVAPTAAHGEEIGDHHAAGAGQQVRQPPIGGGTHGESVEQHQGWAVTDVDGHLELTDRPRRVCRVLRVGAITGPLWQQQRSGPRPQC